jgi:hypothetical protein
MVRTIACAAAFTVLSLGSAYAGPCSPEQEQIAGAESGKLSKAAVAAVMPVEGRQMINLTECDARGSVIKAEFRYNYMSGGAYYWLEARADIDGATGTLKVKKLSDGLESANAAKGGQLLASR